MREISEAAAGTPIDILSKITGFATQQNDGHGECRVVLRNSFSRVNADPLVRGASVDIWPKSSDASLRDEDVIGL